MNDTCTCTPQHVSSFYPCEKSEHQYTKNCHCSTCREQERKEHMLKGKRLLVTGGSGTLGKEIIRRAHEEDWGCQITIFSRDVVKHFAIMRQYPGVQSVIGDVRDETTLLNAMAGKDIVIHGAAVKHIPVSEVHSIDTWEINVQGSMNVLRAAMYHGTPEVIGISTDKACHPANAYGASKYLMEKAFQEFARIEGLPTRFGLLRYGNVLESTGSVVEAWKRAVANGEPIKMTHPDMTRFYISPHNAVQIILDSIYAEVPSGHILVPQMKSLSLLQLAEFALSGMDYEIENIPIRPGEKMHETLVTVEELDYTEAVDKYFVIRPTTSFANDTNFVTEPFTSLSAMRLTGVELEELLRNE
jgi:UDP-N-acetylglucosamine 4,6-dehydratase/5-epimerase